MKPLNLYERFKMFIQQIFCKHHYGFAYMDLDGEKHYICFYCLKEISEVQK